MSGTLPNQIDVLARVADVIASRQGCDPDKSYVARLFHKGTDTILKKVGEEATETVLAAKDLAAAPASAEARQALVGELADLWFHSMVAMATWASVPKTSWPSWRGGKACPAWKNSPGAVRAHPNLRRE